MSSIDAMQGYSAQDAADATLTKAKGDSLANKEAFLQMLVAQLQNQDPLNPADGVQFLTQLSQFSQLEQTMGIREDLRGIQQAIANGSLTPADESNA